MIILRLIPLSLLFSDCTKVETYFNHSSSSSNINTTSFVMLKNQYTFEYPVLCIILLILYISLLIMLLIQNSKNPIVFFDLVSHLFLNTIKIEIIFYNLPLTIFMDLISWCWCTLLYLTTLFFALKISLVFFSSELLICFTFYCVYLRFKMIILCN